MASAGVRSVGSAKWHQYLQAGGEWPGSWKDQHTTTGLGLTEDNFARLKEAILQKLVENDLMTKTFFRDARAYALEDVLIEELRKDFHDKMLNQYASDEFVIEAIAAEFDKIRTAYGHSYRVRKRREEADALEDRLIEWRREHRHSVHQEDDAVEEQIKREPSYLGFSEDDLKALLLQLESREGSSTTRDVSVNPTKDLSVDPTRVLSVGPTRDLSVDPTRDVSVGPTRDISVGPVYITLPPVPAQMLLKAHVECVISTYGDDAGFEHVCLVRDICSTIPVDSHPTVDDMDYHLWIALLTAATHEHNMDSQGYTLLSLPKETENVMTTGRTRPLQIHDETTWRTAIRLQLGQRQTALEFIFVPSRVLSPTQRAFFCALRDL
ncbi:hypothetical protein MMC13_006215 [Lambiella insularis]|nr:hypothetical protein [Lambiella insularis]